MVALTTEEQCVHCRFARRKSLPSKNNITASLHFNQGYVDESKCYRKDVLWTEETEVELQGDNQTLHFSIRILCNLWNITRLWDEFRVQRFLIVQWWEWCFPLSSYIIRRFRPVDNLPPAVLSSLWIHLSQPHIIIFNPINNLPDLHVFVCVFFVHVKF